MRCIILTAAAALLLCGAAPAPWVLTPDGLGPIRIGMTQRQVRAAIHAGFQVDGAGDEACEEVGIVGVKGVYLMFQKNRLTSIALGEGSRLATDKGLHVGSTEQAVRAAYRWDLRIKPHAYNAPPAYYLTAWDKARHRGVKYSTDSNRVVESIAAGDESIQYIEGCA